MNKDLHTFIDLVRQNLDRAGEELDRRAEAWLGKPADTFDDGDYARLLEHPEILNLFARYEREEAHLHMLEEELRREADGISSPIARAELDEDIDTGD